MGVEYVHRQCMFNRWPSPTCFSIFELCKIPGVAHCFVTTTTIWHSLQETQHHTQKIKHYYSLYKFIKIEIVVLGINNCVMIRFAILHYYFLQDVLIDTRLFHYLNKAYDWILVVLHTTFAMFGKFLGHAWRLFWGWNKEYSVSVHWGQTHFKLLRGAKWSLDYELT